MIIIGHRKVHYGASQPSHLVCPTCEEKGTTVIHLYSRHLQFFWIPTLPIGRTGESYCTHCNCEIKKNKMPHDFKLVYYNLKADNRPPLWQFSGLVILLCLGYLIWDRGIMDDKNEQEYLKNPQANDLYRYRTPSRDYSSYKVKSVATDSISLLSNKYTATKILRSLMIDNDTCFDGSFFTLSRNEVIALYDSGVIYDIVRKESLYDKSSHIINK